MDLSELTKADWEVAAEEAIDSTPTGLYIDGEFIPAQEDARLETINPANGHAFQRPRYCLRYLR
jgi:hypothetical protein